MFILIFIICVIVVALILAFSHQDDKRPIVEQSVNIPSFSTEEKKAWDDLTNEELKSAALEHVYHLTSFASSELDTRQRLIAIADYRKRVHKMSDSRIRRAYNEWLDFAERRHKEELENYAKRRNTKENAKRIPRP